MKTIITEIIKDDKNKEHEVIKGFSDPVIEPVETGKNTTDLIKSTPEMKAHNNKIQEIETRNKNITQTKNLLKAAVNKKFNPKSSDVDKKEADDIIKNEAAKLKVEEGKKDELLADLQGINNNILKKRKELYLGNLIYFDPAPGEEIITVEKYNEYMGLSENLESGQALCKNCDIIQDRRGVEYWLNGDNGWEKIKIEHINVEITDGAILPVDLTPENIAEITDEAEVRRIAGLSVDDKDTEKQLVIDGVATQAAAMRSKLEIQGSTAGDALTASQDWYNEEVGKIDAKYV